MSDINLPDNSGADAPINVVMVLQSLPPLPSGGAEIQALRLAEVLVHKGIKVSIITPGIGKIRGFEKINGVDIFRLHSPLNYLLDLLFFIQKKSAAPKTIIEFDDNKTITNAITRKIGIGARLRYIIFLLNAWFFLQKRKTKIDIIHSHTIEWPGYVSAQLSKWMKKKLIIKDSTMNGIFNILRFPSGKKKQELIIRQGHFVAMTKMIQDNFISAGISPDRITRIANGININGAVKTDYTGNKKVLFVGNLYQQPAKGIDILLRAWPKVLKVIPDAELDIVGDGDLDIYNKYATELNINGSVKFQGKRNDVHRLMTETDLFVLPSRREGMPNVLMEAMLAAVPAVATDISGSQDLIDHNKNGMLVPPANINQLADSIIFMLQNRDQAETMARNARKNILDNYGLDKIADQYIKLYRK